MLWNRICVEDFEGDFDVDLEQSVAAEIRLLKFDWGLECPNPDSSRPWTSKTWFGSEREFQDIFSEMALQALNWYYRKKTNAPSMSTSIPFGFDREHVSTPTDWVRVKVFHRSPESAHWISAYGNLSSCLRPLPFLQIASMHIQTTPKYIRRSVKQTSQRQRLKTKTQETTAHK